MWKCELRKNKKCDKGECELESYERSSVEEIGMI
jgi:hypothetical protein